MTTTKPKTPARSTRSTRPARSKTPVFDAMIEEARRTPPGEWVSHEELSQELAITDDERAAARPRLNRWLQEDAEEEAEAASGSQQADGATVNGQAPKQRARRKATSR
jgi:hypothetical protein